MEIRRRRLPGTDMDLSVICFGTVPIGTVDSDDQAFRLLDAYAELGGNFVDTAEIYSDWVEGAEKSRAEARIGRWLRARGMAGRVTVATKGGHPRWGSLGVMRLTPEEIRDDLHASRERLGLDTIPLYYLHRDDPVRPVGEMMDVLDEAVAEGKVRYVGCSNWEAWRIREARNYAARRGKPAFVIDQMRWSLAHVNAESQRIPGLVEMNDELHRYHRETGLAAAAYSSQAQGFFSGAYGRDVEHPDTKNGDKIRAYYYSEANFRVLDRVVELAGELGRPPTQVALAYLLHQPFAAYPIIGTTLVDHLRESCGAHDLEFTDEQVRRLETGGQ